MLLIASQSVMARRLRGSLTWERFALFLSLGIAGVALGQANGAVIGAVVGFVFVTTLGEPIPRRNTATVSVAAFETPRRVFR